MQLRPLPKFLHLRHGVISPCCSVISNFLLALLTSSDSEKGFTGQKDTLIWELDMFVLSKGHQAVDWFDWFFFFPPSVKFASVSNWMTCWVFRSLVCCGVQVVNSCLMQLFNTVGKKKKKQRLSTGCECPMSIAHYFKPRSHITWSLKIFHLGRMSWLRVLSVLLCSLKCLVKCYLNDTFFFLTK